MKSIDIIFTVDYEIHGAGVGSFVDFCYRPTQRMLEIANKYGAKITLMAEMEHYFAMLDHPAEFEKDILMFEKQTKYAIKEGHDVQLHLHPQWENADLKDGKWVFPYTKKEISLLCDDYDYAYSRINKAKAWMEDNYKALDPSYECIGYRAGYFQMQPSANIAKALLENGVICDTSVIKGNKRNNWVGDLDYTSAPSHYFPYRCSMENVSIEDKHSPFMEFPVFSKKHNKVKSYIERTLLGKQNITSATIQKIQRSKLSGLKFYSENSSTKDRIISRMKRTSLYSWQPIDFCISEPDLIIKEVRKIARKDKRTDIPFLFIGHSKDFVYANHFRELLLGLKKIKGCNFMSFKEAIGKYYQYGE